jgi:predicted metal-dependent peptidase
MNELYPPASASQLRRGWFEQMLDETQFLQRYPHYAGVLARMEPVATDTVKVMAVSLRRWEDPAAGFQLLINRDFFERYPQYREGVLLHEIQHVVLGHLTTAKFHSVRRPQVMELAMEISANEYVREPLPANGVGLRMFSQFGIQPGQSTMERYALLQSACDSGQLELEDSWFSEMFDMHRPCQAGAGGGAGVGDMLDARSDGATERNWGRKMFSLGAPTSEAVRRRMKEAIAAHLAGDRGGDDDPLQDDTLLRRGKELSRMLRDPGPSDKVNWARVLREAFPQRRQIQPDYLRPNRRFPKRVGEIPGRRRRPPKPKLLVGIDTSGSMTSEALGRVAREVQRLALYASLTLAECDAAIHRIYAPGAALGPFVGGGDTNFVPVFDEARVARRFEGLVYFTDGKGNQPKTAPSVPTLWVLTHTDPFYPTWGKVLVLPGSAGFTR